MPEMESPKVTVIKRSESQMRFFDMCVDHYLNKNDWLEFDNSSALGSNKEVEVEKQLEEYRRRRGQSPTKRFIGKVQSYAYLVAMKTASHSHHRASRELAAQCLSQPSST